MTILTPAFLLNQSQFDTADDFAPYIAKAQIANFTLNAAASYNAQENQITFLPVENRNLTPDEKTALLNVLPGGATAWSFGTN